MHQVTLDPTLKARLNGCDELVEFFDEHGAKLGYFVPRETYRKLLVEWSRSHITDEELERRAQEPGGRTLAEIWKDLESRQ